MFQYIHCINNYFILGAQYNEEGDIIISEEEFLEVKKLKELKAKYKNDFEELKNLKAKVQYCQRLVDNCRQKLIQGMVRNKQDLWVGGYLKTIKTSIQYCQRLVVNCRQKLRQGIVSHKQDLWEGGGVSGYLKY